MVCETWEFFPITSQASLPVWKSTVISLSAATILLLWSQVNLWGKLPWIRTARFLFVGKEIHGFLEPSFRPQKVCFSLYRKLPIIRSVFFFSLSTTPYENSKHIARQTSRTGLCIETWFPPLFLQLLLFLPVAFSSSFISLPDIITRCDLLTNRFSFTMLSFYFLYNGISRVSNHRKIESWELFSRPG